MNRILCTAVVDCIRKAPVSTWEVTVTGVMPCDHVRTYYLDFKTDNEAAREGIRLFVDEMEALQDARAQAAFED